jgi:hypothetical protein
MKVTNPTFLIKNDGKLYWIKEVPVEPIPFGVGDEQYFGSRMDEYRQSLQSAKDQAIEVGNEKEVIVWYYSTEHQRIRGTTGKAGIVWEMEPDTLYTLTGEYEVEIRNVSTGMIRLNNQTSGSVINQLAFFSLLESKPKEEESQAEFDLYMEFGKVLLNLSLEAASEKVIDPSRYVFEQLKERGFTIQRNKTQE